MSSNFNNNFHDALDDYSDCEEKDVIAEQEVLERFNEFVNPPQLAAASLAPTDFPVLPLDSIQRTRVFARPLRTKSPPQT